MYHLSTKSGFDGFGLNKQNIGIMKTLYYTWYQDGSQTKCAIRETAGILKTGWTKHDKLFTLNFIFYIRQYLLQ